MAIPTPAVRVPNREPWYFKGKRFGPKDVPVGAWGFVFETITNNGKRYIGRCKFARKDWRWYAGSGRIMQAHIKKYGRNGLIRNILSIHYSFKETADEERRIVAQRNAVADPNYYNLHEGGAGNRVDTRKVDWGHKISKALTGRKQTQEHIENMRRSKIGKPMPASHKKATGERSKGNRYRDKPIVAITNDYKDLYFPSVTSFAEKYDFSRSTVTNWASGYTVKIPEKHGFCLVRYLQGGKK